MKIQTIFMILLMIALLFAAIGGIIGDFRTYYPEAGNVSTSWESKYSYFSKANESFFNIQSDLQKISSSESGWERILGGLTVFAKSVITALLAILTAPLYVGGIISSVAAELRMPDVVTNIIVPIIILMIIGSVIFMVVKFLHRSPVA